MALGSNSTSLELILTATDKASGVMRVFAGVMGSVVVGALSDAARAAAEDAANTVKLQTAVENAGNSYEQLEPIIAQRIKHGQDLAFTDDQVRDSLTALTQTTGSFTSAMELQTLAMDISRAKNMDLTTASELVGKVAQGNTSILKRYGVVLDEHATAADALAAMQKKFGGQAEAYGQTTAAAMFKVKDSIDEWKESIGAALGPAQGLVMMLPGLSAGFTLVTTTAGLASPALKAFTVSALTAAAPILAVAAAVVLVVAALLQVKETVDVVLEHWDVFVYALKTGQLNDIPVFGFFFHMAQNVIGLLQTIQSLWNAVSSAFNGGAAGMAPTANENAAGFNQYDAGTPYVPYDQIAKIHKGERIVTAADNARGSWGGGGSVLNLHFNAPIYGMQNFRDEVRAVMRDARLAGGLRGIA